MPRVLSRLLPISLVLCCLAYVGWRRYIYTGRLYLQTDYHGPPDSPPERVLLVSAYFPFPKAKHSQDEYDAWLGNFLSRITADLYFFTTPEMADTVRRLRGDLPVVVNTHYASPREVEPLRGRGRLLEEQRTLDRERDYHNADLYAVWAAKPFFVNEALHHVDDLFFRRTQAPFPGFNESGGGGGRASRYKYVFWADSGSFRDPHAMQHWPCVETLDAVWREGARLSGSREEDLFFIPIQYAPPGEARTWTEVHGPIDSDLSEGSFFGGHPEAVRWWYRTYFAYFHYYIDRGIFVGKDQTLINSLLFLFRDRVINVWSTDPDAPEYRSDSPLGDCKERWWYYIYWLGTPREQLAHARLLYEGRTRCRVTRVVAFADVLRRTYGQRWRGPTPTLQPIEDT